MTNGNGNAICSIIRTWRGGEIQQLFHHLLHLLFVGIAVPCDRLFDLRRCVFHNRETSQCGGNQDSAARLPDRDGSRDISSKEEFFNGHFIGLELVKQRLHILKQFQQAQMHWLASLCAKYAASQEGEIAVLAFSNRAISSNRRTGINAKHDTLKRLVGHGFPHEK